MENVKLIRILKICIVIGISLLLLGHYIISYSGLPEKWGVPGIMLGAVCAAFGIIFSLPTKMYLTFLLVNREGKSTNKTLKNKKSDK